MAPTADAVVGMMDAAYFVGRKELLDFINETLDLKLIKIEQTASGAVACQLFDIMYPRSIAMSKVNWGAKNDYEFVQNYKILQAGFNKHHVQRYVDVDKLIRAKYQDNLEFMQWFKAFFDQSGGAQSLADYNPREVRTRGKGGNQFNAQFGGSGGGSSISSNRSKLGTGTNNTTRIATNSRQLAPASPSSKARATAADKTKQSMSPGSPTSRNHRPLRERHQQQQQQTQLPPPITTSTIADDTKESSSGFSNEQQLQQEAEISALTSKNTQLESQVKELETKVQDLEVAVMDIEKERDFYFEKLRNVEVLLQVHEESMEEQVNDQEPTDLVPSELVSKIFKVLYATPEDEVIVNNDGELIPAEDLLSQELSNTL